MSRFSSLVLLCIMVFSSLSYAQKTRRWGIDLDLTKRAADREKGRWSLGEWLEMKERNRMMDMWLSMNSPSPFEFSISGSLKNYKSQVEGNATSESYSTFFSEFSAYAQFVGVTAEYENNGDEGYNDLNGMLNIRLLGDSIQNTAFTIHYGQRAHENDTSGRRTQQFGQVSLQVYLTKYFGIDGKYRQYLPTETDSTGEIEGNQSEAGVFIDFNAFRIFGTWYKEQEKTKLPAATDPTTTEKTGIKSGLKIFF